jgi:membrane fusion protein
MTPLFRQEAIDAQRQRLLGEVSIARPLPTWAFTAIAVGLAAALIAFAFLGGYTRRERVDGFLVPDAGAARLLAPTAATVADLLVNEGDAVVAGTPLARLSVDRSTASGQSESRVVQKELGARSSALDSEIAQNRLLALQEAERVRRRVVDLRNELAQAEGEIQLQEQRVALAEQEVVRTAELERSGFASKTLLRARATERLDQSSRLQGLRRERAAKESELRAAEGELPAVDLRRRSAEDQLARQKSELQQSMVQEEARRETLIRAPIDGVVTNIAAARGDSLAADAPLATVLPRGSGLRAQLLVPTRAIGFVRPGQAVVLRYDAFPYQRFGQARGTVLSVSQTVWSAGDRIGPLTAREPVYRIDVRLERQTMASGDQQFALRPGMGVNADILLEKRTVFEWVFEPVLELRGRLQ